MAASGSQRGVGELLREWRERRSRTQLDLALDAGISSRHLSFVETGRSKPGRDMLLRVLGQLEVPFREQNQLLLAAGHAPAFPERSFDHADLAPVRDALGLILDRHNPYPAVAFDRHWDLVAANATMWALTEGLDIDPALLGPPLNILRVGFHPKGLAPFLANLGEWRAHFLERLGRQLTATRDERLAALLEEVENYPVPGAAGKPETREPLGPLKVRPPVGGELSFVGMFAAFDTPFEVTASELAVELMYPADRPTADVLEAFARERGRD